MYSFRCLTSDAWELVIADEFWARGPERVKENGEAWIEWVDAEMILYGLGVGWKVIRRGFSVEGFHLCKKCIR